VSGQVIDDVSDVTKLPATPPEDVQEKAAPTTEAPPRRSRGLGFWALVQRHRGFSVLLAIGLVLRVITMIGYYPAMWFNDSFDYLHAALAFYPHPVRPDGYSFLLVALEPFHSFALVAGLQHLMGLGIGVMVYAVLRKRFKLPGWGATLAAAPVLLDAYQIQLEQLIMSDVLFEFLLVAIITLLIWYPRPSWKIAAVVGLLIGLAAVTRSVGTPVLVACVAYMIVRRMRWRVIATMVALCALPMAAYAGWYASWHGKFALTGTSGIFLYARVSAFADCDKIKNVPTSEIPLCPENLKEQDILHQSQDVIWSNYSPLTKYAPNKFGPATNQLASDFSKRAIMAQPGDYLKVMSEDFFRTFKWNRTVFPDPGTYSLYQFGKKSEPLPTWYMGGGKNAQQEADQYEQGNARGKVVEPFAGVMRFYQKWFYLRGTMVGVILLVGLAGMIPLFGRRRTRKDRSLFGLGWGGRALLPWITATGLLLAPAATAEFDYRYVLPIVPIGCIAAGIAFSGTVRKRLRRRGGLTASPSA